MAQLCSFGRCSWRIVWCRQVVAEALRAAMTQTLDGSRGRAPDIEASLWLHEQPDLLDTPPSATLQVTASTTRILICTKSSWVLTQELLKRPMPNNNTLSTPSARFKYTNIAPGNKLSHISDSFLATHVSLKSNIAHPEATLSAMTHLQAAALALEKAVCLHDAFLVRQLVHAEGVLVDQLSQVPRHPCQLSREELI